MDTECAALLERFYDFCLEIPRNIRTKWQKQLRQSNRYEGFLHCEVAGICYFCALGCLAQVTANDWQEKQIKVAAELYTYYAPLKYPNYCKAEADDFLPHFDDPFVSLTPTFMHAIGLLWSTSKCHEFNKVCSDLNDTYSTPLSVFADIIERANDYQDSLAM